MTRRGLVLGGGGVLGAAWMIGALATIAEHWDWDPREAEFLVGTSAGAVLAGLLGAGLPVTSLLNHQLGRPDPDTPLVDYDHDRASGGALPPRPRWRIGSTALLARAALRPRRFPPLAALSALAPHGQGTLAPVGRLIEAAVPAGEWAPHPGTWIVAMDYDRGRRVAFGRPGAPPASLSEAVVASCAIPGWYSPVVIGGRRYVDGGACSPTSVDLLAGLDLDQVVVLAPMAAFETDTPPSVIGKLERRFRRAVTGRMLREAGKVRREGTDVVLLAPTPEDLRAIGVNLMDPRRRLRVLETSLRTTSETLARRAPLAAAG
jgi:NTE family protein